MNQDYQKAKEAAMIQRVRDLSERLNTVDACDIMKVTTTSGDTHTGLILSRGFSENTSSGTNQPTVHWEGGYIVVRTETNSVWLDAVSVKDLHKIGTFPESEFFQPRA